MPRHILQPLPRAFAGHRDGTNRRQGLMQDEGVWERMDRCQVLGNATEGHTGCVNALSWSDDGSTLLSGSDDTRICIWASDPSSSTSPSPHPLKLVDSIDTGHRANIFSAKFLPNASTPTIVSCAADKDIRVFEVERLGRAERTVGLGIRDNLYGEDGPGTRVLKCHTDRTKRIATENSPFLFLTVSEDGTVRQHDLRRPHTCRSECPDPLFRAPTNVELYSLSVSTVTPHMFAVAGVIDTAFICDRRMIERHNPSWGNNIKSSGQVHCVRRLGLSEEQWKEAGPGGNRVPSRKHITCVKMSPDHADEVICAFAHHSTAIFSTYDSPYSESMRQRSSSPTIIPPNEKPISKSRPLPGSPPEGVPHYTPQDFLATTKGPKRRQSELSSPNHNTSPPSRARLGEQEDGSHEEAMIGPSTPSESADTHIDVQGLIDDIVRDAQEMEDVPMTGAGDGVGDVLLDLEGVGGLGTDGNERDEVGPSRWLHDPSREGLLEDSHHELNDSRGLAGRLEAEDSTEPNLNSEGESLIPLMIEVDDYDMARLRSIIEGDADDYDDDLGEEMDLDEYMEEDEDYDFDEDDEDWEDEDEYDSRALIPADNEFSPVDMITPRRCFKGARNMRTVKDCNFLGAYSDKVCSGSDDGHFFVWDKTTGRLEGIWEGDSHVVNVMEQHPTLPLVTVSGIDKTVKLFSPLAKRPDPSFARTHLRDSIIKANTERADFEPASSFGRVSVLNFLASRGIRARFGGGGNDSDDDEDDRQPECTTQ